MRKINMVVVAGVFAVRGGDQFLQTGLDIRAVVLLIYIMRSSKRSLNGRRWRRGAKTPPTTEISE